MASLMSMFASQQVKSSNPIDDFFGSSENEPPRPKVDPKVVQAEVEAAERADREARAESQQRRRTEHEARAAQLREKYNLKEPKPEKKKSIIGTLTRSTSKETAVAPPSDPAISHETSLAKDDGKDAASSDKWFKKLFKSAM